MNDVLRRGRLSSERKSEIINFTSSLSHDEKLFHADILVDFAHVIMLFEQKIISNDDCSQILKNLLKIENEGFVKLSQKIELEDIHACIESRLEELIPENISGKLHTARSRNDEVSTCIRMILRVELLSTCSLISDLISTLAKISIDNSKTIMPGYTHTQIAQPITYGHYLLAHCEVLQRDHDRVLNSYTNVDLSPLGSCAISGTGFPIDRNRTSSLLGFNKILENSLDGSSTRDFIIESISCLSNLSSNLSRLCEELILWSSDAYQFINLPDEYSSPSSIMPQKKNPDPIELSRAKCSKIYGNLISVLSIQKSLPYGYNRDLQEITPLLWDSFDEICSILVVLNSIMVKLEIKKENMKTALVNSFSTATELADVIVREKNLSFRTSYTIVGNLINEAISNKLPLSKINSKLLDSVSINVIGTPIKLTEKEIRQALNPVDLISSRKSLGSPLPSETNRMALNHLKRIKSNSLKTSLMKKKLDESESTLRTLASSFIDSSSSN